MNETLERLFYSLETGDPEVLSEFHRELNRHGYGFSKASHIEKKLDQAQTALLEMGGELDYKSHGEYQSYLEGLVEGLREVLAI